MDLSPAPDYQIYIKQPFLKTSAPLLEHFLMFLMGLSAILINYTASYGTIAGADYRGYLHLLRFFLYLIDQQLII